MNPLILAIPLVLLLLFKSRSLISGKPKGYDRVMQWRNVAKKWVEIYEDEIPYHIILGIMAQESMGDPTPPKGSSGEVGLMQITPMGLAYSGSPYTMDQIARDQIKNVETGVMHLAKDYQLFSDLNYAIMSYNIARIHIQRKLDGTATAQDERLLKVGRDYLAKVMYHSKKLLPMLANSSINDPESIDYIPVIE